MNKKASPTLSVVVPLFNEAASLPQLYQALKPVLDSLKFDYEIIFVNDGSVDGSGRVLAELAQKDRDVRVLTLARNFGKEVAVTAGIHRASGEAIIMLDADGQHPVTVIPEFIARWQAGAKVVVGRRSNRHTNLYKRFTARLFYGTFRRLTGIPIDLETSDFRLIDREVQQQFCTMTERNRITRGLIDWLGYEREYVLFAENARLAGTPPYSFRKLFKLAIDSAISLSTSPLYLTAYVGAVVLPISTLLGLGMAINFLLRDPLKLHATGTAYLIVLALFLIGILMVSQGIIGLYLSHIHSETQNRPLYVIDESRSKGWS
jgi:dolichol-phosphate mannosyltransferase